jgi:hypothetical protein
MNLSRCHRLALGASAGLAPHVGRVQTPRRGRTATLLPAGRWSSPAGRALSTLYLRTGKRQQPQEQLETERAMCREMDLRFWLEDRNT